MKIGIISTFHEKCGVSAYTENLVEGFIEKGHDVKVIANYSKDPTQEDGVYVKRAFHAPFLTHQFDVDYESILEFFKDRDIIEVEFETNLYHPSTFPKLLQLLRILDKQIVFKMHSSGMWPNLNTYDVYFITHSAMWCSHIVLPMGIKFYDNTPPQNYKSITSFGLGRNNDDRLISARDAVDPSIEYNTSYGNRKWLPIKDLVKNIQESWIISLLYPPVGASVSSSAVTLALGCNRPIIVTDTNWFDNVRRYPCIFSAENDRQIQTYIKFLTDPNNIEEINTRIGSTKDFIKDMDNTYEDFINKHILVYNEFV